MEVGDSSMEQWCLDYNNRFTEMLTFNCFNVYTFL